VIKISRNGRHDAADDEGKSNNRKKRHKMSAAIILRDLSPFNEADIIRQ